MAETNYNPQTQTPISTVQTARTSGGRQRIISSCLTCRRRKVKCDHTHPVCSACNRGSHICIWSDHTHATAGPGRISKPGFSGSVKAAKDSDVQIRLDRLELLLEKALSSHRSKPVSSARSSIIVERQKPKAQNTPSLTSQPRHGGLASDNGDGTLLIDGVQSQFVSSLHYALLADEIQDTKALLGHKTDEERREVPQSTLVDLLSLGRAHSQSNLKQLLPASQEHRDNLLKVYFANVDLVVRITHRPTIVRKMRFYDREAHPISFAIYFSAINSLPPNAVMEHYGESKETLLNRFQLGVEISLARENYLTTLNPEIFQGFVLWLTCITREEDMGKAWVLLGLAFRIALNLGLHRDPSLFPVGSMGALTIELRRRMWHQLGHLEFRAAECKGQEPSITEDFYTTKFPRNIDDEDLTDGASPGPAMYDEEKFTTMTFQLVRWQGMRALRRIVLSTYRLERRMLDSGLNGTSRPNPARELQRLYGQIKVMLDEVNNENQQRYLRHLNPDKPMERLTLGLASLLEWRCYLLFWLRMPRAYRDDVFSEDIRRSIFEKSLSCIETLNGAATDADAAPFQWHIGGIASFQAIMHVLSELRTPLFDAPDRERALRALQISRILRENNTAKAWQAVKNMIDKAVAEHNASLGGQSQSSSVYVDTPLSMLNPSQLDGSNSNAHTYPPLNSSIPSKTFQQGPLRQIHEPNVLIQPEPRQQVPMDPMQALQTQTAPSWDDFNLNNIANVVGDIRPGPGAVPDFDFGFWGDPFNHESETAIPLTDSSFPLWSG